MHLAYKQSIALSVETLGSKFGIVAVSLLQTPALSLSSKLIMPSLVIALVAILETMLSAKIADSMTKTKHNSRKEMFGLGLANIASGILGGMPATAALARTALNIRVGATHKISAVLCSIFVAGGALLFLPYFQFMPMAVIAAILVNVAVHMVERPPFHSALSP